MSACWRSTRPCPICTRERETLQRDHAALAEHEKKRLQVDHADVGGWLMQDLEPARAPVSRDRAQPSAGSAASAPIPRRSSTAASRCPGPVADLFLLDPEQRQFAETALCAERSLGLDKMAFGQVLGTIGAMIPETEAIFETDLLAKQHPELILEQAREVLMLRSLHALREINTLRAVAGDAASRTLELEEETRRDALTGVYNRAYLDQFLAREFEQFDAPQMAAERRLRGSGQLQEHQRQLRPSGRRPHPAGDCAHSARQHARDRLDRPLRRRGVRRGAAGDRCRDGAQHLRAHRDGVSQHRPRHRLGSRQGDDLDRLRDARRADSSSPTSPNSSRPPTRRSTPPSCAAATAPCPSIGRSPQRARQQRLKRARAQRVSHAN